MIILTDPSSAKRRDSDRLAEIPHNMLLFETLTFGVGMKATAAGKVADNRQRVITDFIFSTPQCNSENENLGWDSLSSTVVVLLLFWSSRSESSAGWGSNLEPRLPVPGSLAYCSLSLEEAVQGWYCT
jgi:hypothetical protein